MSTKYSSKLYDEPETIEIPEIATPGDKQKNRFSIDFSTLERVLAPTEEDEEDAQENVDSESYYGLGRRDTYRTIASANRANQTKSKRIVLYSPSSDSIFRAASFQELGILGMDLTDIFCEDGEHLWWMDVQNPSEKELRMLCSAFRVHPLTIEDILNQEVQEKIEDFTHYYLACVQSYRADDTSSEKPYKPYTIYLVVFPTGTLSFSFTENNHVDNIVKRIKVLEGYMSINSDWLFYAFLDDIVDSFNPSINKIEKQVNKIEDQVYTTREDDKQVFVRQIEQVRKDSSSLLRLLSGKNHILIAFEKHHCGDEPDKESSEEESNPSHNLRLFINDVKDHVSTMLANLHQFESLLARSQNHYLAGLAIDNMRGRGTTTRFLNVVAVIGMILTLMNIICALFSTNVNANIALYVNDTPAWFIIVGSEAAVSLLLFWLARRLNWC